MPDSKSTDKPETKLLRDRNLQIIFAVTLTAVLGVSSITPVFPDVVREFGISGAQVGLLITFFTLPGVFLAPIIGVLADRFGRRRILAPSLFLFAIAGTACFFARDFSTLLVLRTFQGIGGAGLGSLNATIIGDLYSGERRAEAMGLNASVLSIGTASYPAIGGALAILGWQYPFILPIVALPAGILVLVSLRNPEPRNRQSMKEYLGNTWTYLKNIRVVGLFAAGVLTFVIIYGAFLTYFSLLLDESFGASSFVIGLIMSVMSLSTAVVSSQLGRINRRLSLGTIIKIAFAVYALALVLIPFMPSLWLLLVPVIILGVAHGANVPSIQTAVAGLAPIEYRAAFMSVNATMLRLGQTLAPPLMAVAYVYGGFEATFLSAAGLALLVPLVSIIFGRKKSDDGTS
jgi:ACDE family multidrug resistance protein